MDARLNQLAKIDDFEKAIILAQYAHENGFRGGTALELYQFVKSKLDLTGLSNTAGLPEEFPEPETTLHASNAGEWTVLGPGVYNKIGAGTIELSDDEFAFAQFDGTDFNRVLRVKVPQQEGVDEINPLGEDLPKEKAVAIYVAKNMPAMRMSKNLFSSDNILANRYILSTGSHGIQASQGWAYSGMIDIRSVPDGAYITLSSDKLRRGCGFFDINQDNIRYFDVVTGTFQKESGDIYFAFNLKSPDQPNWTWAQLEIGDEATNYEPYLKIVVKESVEDLPDISDKAYEAYNISQSNDEKLSSFDFIVIEGSSNQLDPGKVFKEGYLDTLTGDILTGTGVTLRYQVSDFIPAVSGETKEIINNFEGVLGFRNYVCYDNNSVRVLGITVDPETKLVTIPDNNDIAFIRFSLIGENYPDAGGLYIPENIGVFSGTGNEFEPYYKANTNIKVVDPLPVQIKENDSIATVGDIKKLVQQEKTTDGVNFNLNENGLLTVSKDELGEITMTTKPNNGYTRNDVVNFRNYSILNVSSNNTDDVAPIHAANTTIGANHGGPSWIATIADHGLVNEDMGKVFVQGDRTFVLARIVNENQVQFIGENFGTDSSPSHYSLNTGSATQDGSSYTITERTSQQLYQAVKNVTLKVLADGYEIKSGSGIATYIEVLESYEIKSIPSILDNLRERVGSDENPDFDGDGFIKIENIYRFDENLNCLVFVRTRQLSPMVFADIMATQAIILGGTNDGTTQYYIPNSNPLNGQVDLRKPTAYTWSNSIPSTFVINDNQPEPDNPPNRVIQYKGNVGFMVGYLPNKGVSKELNSFTARSFEIRNNTGKVYPHAVESARVGDMPDIDTVFNIAMYRSFTDLTKTRIGNRLSYFVIKDNSITYVFLDYSGSMVDHVKLDGILPNGKEIEIVESRNTILLSDIYNNGLIVKSEYVEGDTCYLVVSIR